MSQQEMFAIETKVIDPILVGGIRTQGRYEDCGKIFGKLGRSLGRYAAGPPLCLYYDGEYREEDANFEPCFAIRKMAKADGIDVRTLAGGTFLTLIHKGPYSELGRSYEKLIRFAKEQNHTLGLPSREVFLKGPGMIFKGNPKKYLTEIQMPIETTP